MLMAIAEGITSRHNFSGYSFRSDLTAEALLAMTKAVEKWNCLGADNPFGYFHRCAWNAVLKCIQREGKHSRLTALLREEMVSRISNGQCDASPEPWRDNDHDNHHIHEPVPPGSTLEHFQPVSV